ncbi:phenylalanine--tRNA ligase subunit alpha [Desulfatitalea sp. M08but]|uniref:Phenylalanine--tRNA ligase alpha subunit n=2 Tax=Desulfatitalea alkaliphila TaxID=2929485 RepID=A0AA41R5D9_9BACT|nr:phenylalanine--tRNA ligase subunit alpha [Desulfatitalea alkaliphila]MCJ8501146.1 phenylalanine--tRNA ligase subunit alpha [Desulfatitalea alkaliphila]
MKEIEAAETPEAIQALSIQYLGRKGVVTQLLRAVAQLPPEARPEAGRMANAVKQEIDAACRQALERLESDPAGRMERIDVSLPGRPMVPGTLHPITQITQEICDIFTRMGFEVVEGPEVETDYYNFEALNIPKNHPARDMQDTFYVSEDVVLRTHTSPTQPRVMEQRQPPVRIIAPGKVYRCDSDLTHTPMFHQVEGLLVDAGISFGDLKGTLTAFIHQMFDPRTRLRFRPSFFPFTEPSAEVDMLCVMCRGEGCRVCSQTGWLEILGAGMVHPAVLENVHYDTARCTGFAFGMGVERIAMLKYGIDDIRKYFENDIRFLAQF